MVIVCVVGDQKWDNIGFEALYRTGQDGCPGSHDLPTEKATYKRTSLQIKALGQAE